MIKEIFGPELVRKVSCILCFIFCCLFILAWGFYLVGDIIGALIANAIKK